MVLTRCGKQFDVGMMGGMLAGGANTIQHFEGQGAFHR